MLRSLSKQQIAVRAAISLAAIAVAFFWGGLLAALLSLAGLLAGLGISFLLVSLARPKAQGGELIEIEPALVPLLVYGVADPRDQLRASLLELFSGGHFTLAEKDGELWISKGDEGVELGPCGQVVETRVRGRLMDGDVKLDGLVGHLASAQGKTIPDLKAISEKTSRSWTTPIFLRLRLGLLAVSLLAGVVLFILGLSVGGAGLGLAAGLFWPRSEQLRRLTPTFQAARVAWIDHLGDAEIPAPSISGWAPLMGLSLALGERQMLDRMAERMKARPGRDKPLERLVGACQVLLS